MLKKRVKGCFDIYPNAKEQWQDPKIWEFIETTLKKIVDLYGFSKVTTPVFEYTEIFTRSSGEESDIVNKEMYTFLDKKNRSLTLRPELTAPVIRAYIENGGASKPLSKLYYTGPCFRYDRPQKGRYRQFHQFGIEVIGKKDPIIDVEVISMLLHLFELLGLTKTTLLINSLGSIESRSLYTKELMKYYLEFEKKLSEDSKRRLQSNPLRILDSKDKGDIEINKNAPSIINYLDEESKEHFERVKKGLDAVGISYKIDSKLVRGLDYYNDTVFELVRADDLSAQNTLAAGGVYSGLISLLGGKDTPGIGFALGIERIIQYLLEEKISIKEKPTCTCYLIGMNKACKEKLLPVLQQLRKQEISSELFEGTSIKTGLKNASEKGAKYAIILGEEELQKGVCKIKNLEAREEKEIPLDSSAETIKELTAIPRETIC
ncbi:histidine--tRNA ligase [bacterium]|nr:histidine--tRNA ligase [bacterium]